MGRGREEGNLNSLSGITNNTHDSEVIRTAVPCASMMNLNSIFLCFVLVVIKVLNMPFHLEPFHIKRKQI
jgi:hypothetical protein